MNRIVLICLWIGKIPDYFKYHYDTCKNKNNVDFLFITDQIVGDYNANDNYKFIQIDFNILKNRIDNTLNIDYTFTSSRNICSLKCALGDLFYDYIKNYEYWGFYDIDTLLGDFNKFIIPYTEESYDIISFGVQNFHDRISGPLVIIKNNERNNKLYKRKIVEFIDKLYNYEVDSFDETEFNEIVKSDNDIRLKILYNVCNFSVEKGYPIYESTCSGGRIFVDDREVLLNHFIDKNNIEFYNIGNTIVSYYKKDLLDDFYWVTYFTENYESVGNVLLESIYKFSNRKCLVYTINYTSKLSYQKNEQFIFRRIDIEIDDANHKNRYILINNYKPNILLDALNYMSNKKFIYIDADAYINVNGDNLSDYFKNLNNYPLYNSHVHDWLTANDILPSGKWVNTLLILSEETNVPIHIFPRRKANLILFDINSKWFFEEQVQLYKDYKNKRVGIFRLQDEDAANLLMSKHNLTDCLPVLDMEESSVINMNKFNEYSYNLSQISESVVLPKTKNEVYFFHGFKNSDFINDINKNHLPNVIEHDRLVISYENNTLLFKRFSFLRDKNISTPVNFKVYNLKNELILELNNQLLYNYWVFYIGGYYLPSDYYKVVIDDADNLILFSRIIKIK